MQHMVVQLYGFISSLLLGLMSLQLITIEDKILALYVNSIFQPYRAFQQSTHNKLINSLLCNCFHASCVNGMLVFKATF